MAPGDKDLFHNFFVTDEDVREGMVEAGLRVEELLIKPAMPGGWADIKELYSTTASQLEESCLGWVPFPVVLAEDTVAVLESKASHLGRLETLLQVSPSIKLTLHCGLCAWIELMQSHTFAVPGTNCASSRDHGVSAFMHDQCTLSGQLRTYLCICMYVCVICH